MASPSPLQSNGHPPFAFVGEDSLSTGALPPEAITAALDELTRDRSVKSGVRVQSFGLTPPTDSVLSVKRIAA